MLADITNRKGKAFMKALLVRMASCLNLTFLLIELPIITSSPTNSIILINPNRNVREASFILKKMQDSLYEYDLFQIVRILNYR
jgi:hypothetical protein